MTAARRAVSVSLRRTLSRSQWRRALQTSPDALQASGDALGGERGTDPWRHQRYPLDSLSFARSLEATGVPRPQAESLATHVLDALATSEGTVRSEFVSKDALHRERSAIDASLELSRTELKTVLASLDGSTKRELERLRAECDKLRAEMKYEINKLSSSQRLDLNLEKGRLRDELQAQNDRIVKTDARLDREANIIRTQIETGKNDLLRYSVATITAAGALGLGILRLIL